MPLPDLSRIITVPAGNYNLQIAPHMTILNTNMVYLECQTSSGVPTISLPKISTLPNYAKSWGFYIYVSDADRNASVNNIIIVAAPGDVIAGAASATISVNGGVAEIFVAGNASWGCLLGPAGTSGGGTLNSIYFTTIANQNNYVFNGTPTAWNPGPTPINLVGKNISFYSSDGLIKVPIVNYNWIPLTGTLSIVGKVYSNVQGALYWQ